LRVVRFVERGRIPQINDYLMNHGYHVTTYYDDEWRKSTQSHEVWQ